jgi:hypothetical protein
MQSGHRDTGGGERFEAEYLPPLDESGVWLMPWERQVEAARAWQEAGGNLDGDAAQTYQGEPSRAVPPPSMQTIVRMNTLNVALRERLTQLTGAISNLAIETMGERGAGAHAPVHLDEVRAHRLQEHVRNWFEIVDSARSGMQSLSGMQPASRAAAGSAGRRRGERRQRVVQIDFADRRRAA